MIDREKKIRMIVTDLDNTYLRRDKTISEYTADITQQIRDMGILFVIATARPVRAVKEWLPWLKYDMGVFHNGAVIHDGDHPFANLGIDHPQEVLRLLKDELPDAHLAAECNEVLYANFDTTAIWKDAPYVYTEDFAMLKNTVADKLIVESHTTEENAVVDSLLPEGLYARLCENVISTIMNERATKTNSVRLLADKLGISDEEIVSFGDDYNDIDMLMNFGTGVAVANALPEVKAIAKDLCASCDEDGVAHWLEQHILKAGKNI